MRRAWAYRNDKPDGAAARELAALWRWINARLRGLNHEQTTGHQASR